LPAEDFVNAGDTAGKIIRRVEECGIAVRHFRRARQQLTIANYGTNAGEGGIWMAGCGLSADSSGSLFFAVGNGTFNALSNSGGTEYGDSFICLSTANGLTVADYFTPYNQEPFRRIFLPAFLAQQPPFSVLQCGSNG